MIVVRNALSCRREIVDLRVTVVGTPWRELVFLELATDAGLTGVGEVRMVNKTDTLVACIGELAPRYVVGSDPFDVERSCLERAARRIPTAG